MNAIYAKLLKIISLQSTQKSASNYKYTTATESYNPSSSAIDYIEARPTAGWCTSTIAPRTDVIPSATLGAPSARWPNVSTLTSKPEPSDIIITKSTIRNHSLKNYSALLKSSTVTLTSKISSLQRHYSLRSTNPTSTSKRKETQECCAYSKKMQYLYI